MAYIDYEFYCGCYQDIPENGFDRFAYMASRLLDRHTTGADGIAKLKYFFPEDEEDVMAIKLCAARLCHLLHSFEEAEESAAESYGLQATEVGLQGKVIKSVSSGSESVTYSVGSGATAFDKAVADKAERGKYLAGTIAEYLHGIRDRNGVNLLFMGPYPKGV